MRTLKSAREIVDVLGGHNAVKKLTGATDKAVYYWTGTAHQFPARYYKKMIDALAKRGCKAAPGLWNQSGYEIKAAKAAAKDAAQDAA
jgi:DNA-binding LacI/PurR family transcriptional regulator